MYRRVCSPVLPGAVRGLGSEPRSRLYGGYSRGVWCGTEKGKEHEEAVGMSAATLEVCEQRINMGLVGRPASAVLWEGLQGRPGGCFHSLTPGSYRTVVLKRKTRRRLLWVEVSARGPGAQRCEPRPLVLCLGMRRWSSPAPRAGPKKCSWGVREGAWDPTCCCAFRQKLEGEKNK